MTKNTSKNIDFLIRNAMAAIMAIKAIIEIAMHFRSGWGTPS
ncbi:MAG: hypothetical protein ACRDJF_12150 [Actinomycetota bacterium]